MRDGAPGPWFPRATAKRAAHRREPNKCTLHAPPGALRSAADQRRFRVPWGVGLNMKLGKWDIRPPGGTMGCLAMILISVIASVLLTFLLNLLLRH
jgi:hypothetical protein